MFRHYLQHLQILLKCKIGTFQRNLCTIFLKVLNIYLFLKIFQKVDILMLWRNILQYFERILRKYFNCNEILEIFLTSFCNIMCYVGHYPSCLIWDFEVEIILFRNPLDLFSFINFNPRYCTESTRISHPFNFEIPVITVFSQGIQKKTRVRACVCVCVRTWSPCGFKG